MHFTLGPEAWQGSLELVKHPIPEPIIPDLTPTHPIEGHRLSLRLYFACLH